VRVRVANEELSGQARMITDSEAALQQQVQALSRKKYGWGEGLVIEIVPDGAK